HMSAHAPSPRPGAVRNTGIRATQSLYVMCIEAGDLLDPAFHEMACAKLDEEPDFNLVTSWIELRGPGSNRRVIAPVNQIDADTCDLDAVIGNTDAIHSATVFRRDAWTAADGFDESMPVLAAYALRRRGLQ